MAETGDEIAVIVAGLQEVQEALDTVRHSTATIAASYATNAIATLDTLIQRVQGLERNTPTANEDKLREQAVAEVLKIRGSYDAPGFDACVEAELQTLRAKQPAIAPAELVEAAKAIHKIRKGLQAFDYEDEDVAYAEAALSVAIPAIEAKQRKEMEKQLRSLRFTLGVTKLHLEMEGYTSNHAARKECIGLLEEALVALSQPAAAESEEG